MRTTAASTLMAAPARPHHRLTPAGAVHPGVPPGELGRDASPGQLPSTGASPQFSVLGPLEVVAPMLMISERRAPFLKPVVGATSRTLSFKQFANGTVLIGGGYLGRAMPERNRTVLYYRALAENARTVRELFPVMADARVVRAMMLLRLSTLATGHTGIRLRTAETMAGLLNHGITPIVLEYGSLGCSGDLAPLAHCALAVTGEGTVRDHDGVLRPAAEALAAAGIVEDAEQGAGGDGVARRARAAVRAAHRQAAGIGRPQLGDRVDEAERAHVRGSKADAECKRPPAGGRWCRSVPHQSA